MKVSQTYVMPANEYFKELMRLFYLDYEKNTSQRLEEIDPNALKGLEYITSYGRNGKNRAKVKVLELQFNKIYKTEIISNRGTQIIQYLLDEDSEGNMTVTYSEEIENSDFFTSLNQKIFNLFFKKTMVNRLKAQLDLIYRNSKYNREVYRNQNDCSYHQRIRRSQ